PPPPTALWPLSLHDALPICDWGHAGQALGVFLNGDAITEPDPRGRRIRDNSFLMLFNGGASAVDFTLPDDDYGKAWETVLDTAETNIRSRPPVSPSEPVRVIDRALVVLRRTSPGQRLKAL